VYELDEGALQPAEVALIRAEVIAVDVRDDGYERLQKQKGGVAFVGLGNDESAAAEARVAAGAIEEAADHERRIEIRGVEYRSDEARGRGLAVRAGDRDAVAVPHQLAQHFRALHNGDALRVRGGDLGVRRVDRARHDEHVRALDVRRVCPHATVAPRRSRRRVADDFARSLPEMQ